MKDCVFCKIESGEIPSERVYEDEDVFVINDLHPQAKIHYLMIPKKHFATLAEMDSSDTELLGRALKKISQIAPTIGLENGYRIIINQGEDGGQTIFHLHIHILGGEKLPV